jgi:hypothetical protein
MPKRQHSKLNLSACTLFTFELQPREAMSSTFRIESDQNAAELLLLADLSVNALAAEQYMKFNAH